MFSTGGASCPVLFLKKLIQVLKPGEEETVSEAEKEIMCWRRNLRLRRPLAVLKISRSLYNQRVRVFVNKTLTTDKQSLTHSY